MNLMKVTFGHGRPKSQGFLFMNSTIIQRCYSKLNITIYSNNNNDHMLWLSNIPILGWSF
jgi:hypothetical protein